MENAADLFDNYSKEALLKLLKSQTKEVSKLESKNTKLDQENSYLKFQIEQFKRAMYGSKKERFIASENPEQLAIPFEIDEQEVEQAVESVKEQITYERQKSRQKTSRLYGFAIASCGK